MRLNNLLYYIRLWKLTGIFPVLRFYRLRNQQGKLIQLNLKGYPGTITLRSGTSDIKSFWDLFIGHHNHLKNVNIDASGVIFDIGSNIGLTAVIYANRFPNAAVYAIEPEATNFEMLKRNSAGYTNIICLRKAFWFQHESLTIKNPDSDKWAFTMQPGNDATSVEALTMDDINHLAGQRQIDFLKIDVEGAEAIIFKNLTKEQLSKVHYIGIELHDRYTPDCSKNFYTLISQFDYTEIRNYSGDHILELRHATSI